MTTPAGDRATVAGLTDQLRRTYGRLLEALERADDEALHRRLAPTAPSIAFHVWHAARLADRFGARLPELLPAQSTEGRSERWETDGVAERWGLDPARLGVEQNAMGLSDEDAERITLPGRDQIRQYAAAAFSAAESAMQLVRDADLGVEVTGFQRHPEALVSTICGQLQHAARHLGMIEALRGVAGEHGTATA